MALDPGTRLEPYEVLAPLGAGGTDEVYKARDTPLAPTVALKNLHSGSVERRCWLARVALVLLFAGLADGTGGQTALPRIRSGGADVAALLDLGYTRSATFRSLVDQLERSAVIVYVRFARCTGRVSACLHYLGEKNGDHYVRITVDRFAGSDRALCCLLAQELQHAFELACTSNLRTPRDVERLMSEIGRRWGEGFETNAARDVARAVEQELTRAASPLGGTRP